jgi:selenocysteine lyase/cysteine desulfurase
MRYNSRRTFLQRLAAWSGLMAAPPFFATAAGRSLRAALENNFQADPLTLAGDEHFWRSIRNAYTVSPTVINLNNGGVCPQPRPVQEAVERYNRLSNEAPSYYMWRVLDLGREPLRARLARLAACSPEELAINRNASEALETIIFGLRLKTGDEVVLTKQDYPNMIQAWKQREHRDGIVLKWLSFDLPLEDERQIVDAFVGAFTPRTKVVHITHMINWTGQLLPAKAIAQEAARRGIEVVVDAAHSFAQVEFNFSDLRCDYLGTSLHKWLCAPFGSGLLYVKKSKIKNLYPLFGAPDPESDDIRKFEHLGTRSFAIEQAIGQAIDFHLMIGPQRKEERLRYLKNYWVDKVSGLPGVKVHTSRLKPFSCALALFSIEGKKPEEIADFLFQKYKIHTVAIEWENISGVRVTPNVYTTIEELDALVDAIAALSGV